MATILFYCVIAGYLGVSYSVSLSARMDTIEKQVNWEAFKTKSDFMELRKLISLVNTTGHSDGGGGVDNSNVIDKLSALDAKLERFMQDQLERDVALSKAITQEKVMTRTVLQEIRDSKKVWKVFEDRIKHDMLALSEKSEQLEDIIEHADGGVIIQTIEKEKPCPKNWFQNENTCYFYEKNERLNWYAARIKCHDFGGKLSEPDTAEKMRFLINVHVLHGGHDVWVGATDDSKEGKWVWESSQTAVDFVSWQLGQPNNMAGNQHCMEMGLSNMNDDSCLSENNYICQKLVAN